MRGSGSRQLLLGAASAVLAGLALMTPLTMSRTSGQLVESGRSVAQVSATPTAGESGGFSPSFSIGGMVASPATFALADLQAMPSQTVNVQFTSGAGLEQHTYQGVPLYALLIAAGPQFNPSQKNDRLSWYVSVRAIDGYQAVIAWGELDPGGEAKNVLVAYEADGQMLGPGDGMARLVVPGDVMGGRYVSSISSITLQRAPAQ
jgi:DMSO/TMAO reductase YedYZ molybdopterin-dependent catalytic subunit